MFNEIVDHRKDGTAVPIEEGFESNRNARRHPKRKRTTKGWQIMVEWKDGTTSWIPLKEVKESKPVELAEYAVNNHIQDEPAFAWWVPFTLKRRNRILSKIKCKYWKIIYKFGIRLPHSI